MDRINGLQDLQDKGFNKTKSGASDNDKFLETAVKGDAHFIISGDQDLLTMDQFEGIDIVTVKDFAVYTS